MTDLLNPIVTWNRRLMIVGRIWFFITAIGQIGFITFIAAYYGTRTFSGNFAAWNDRQIITGHVPGDTVGNLMFAAHVLIAAIVTFGGLVQLVPIIRKRCPRFHRWNGRIYIGLACFLAAGGIWMSIVRESYLSIPSAVGVGLNGVLILIFSVFVIRYAMKRDFVRHEVWALRTFMVVSGVWFFRVGIMGWIILNGGPRWMDATLSGPADIGLSFGSYLIPLLGLELFLRARRSHNVHLKRVAVTIISLLTAFMCVGIPGTIFLMWF